MFQQFHLLDRATALRNVVLPLIYSDDDFAPAEGRAEKALDAVGLADRKHHKPSELSGGQQQRVAVARAVAGDPFILLADEPTGNLDSKNGDQVMALLEELHQGGATICMVTHNPDYAKKATRTIHLFDGRVVSETPRAAA